MTLSPQVYPHLPFDCDTIRLLLRINLKHRYFNFTALSLGTSHVFAKARLPVARFTNLQ